MKNIITYLLIFFSSYSISMQAQQKVKSGKVIEYDKFQTSTITPRNISVWIPDEYCKSQKYDVIYMHDGQMLFDGRNNWNHQEWGVDETLTELFSQEDINKCIIVGIWNIPETRFFDYFPIKAISYTKKDMQERFFNEQGKESEFKADEYLEFIVKELKPFIDKHYSTNPEKEHTFIMGSSMGGLISLYGLCEYPHIFGGAACLSIHSLMVTTKLQNQKNAEIALCGFCAYLEDNLPVMNSALIYMDFGDKTLDKHYAPYQRQIDRILLNKGWDRPFWTTNFYAGYSHSEQDWAKRLFVPMSFLLKK